MGENVVIIPDLFKTGSTKKKQANPTNWKFTARKENRAMAEKDLPPAANLKNEFPPVYDQVHGACTAYAVLGCDGYYYHKVNKAWVPSGDFTYYQQRKIQGCDDMSEETGSSVEIGLDAVRKYGACDSIVWPNGQPLDRKPSKAAYENGLKGHEITKYYAIKTPLQIKKALHSGYPVVTSMAWPFHGYDSNYKLPDVSRDVADKCHKGHAVVIVGYDDNKRLFEIRNSWGNKWANSGYAYIGYGTMLKCIWFNDCYAVIK